MDKREIKYNLEDTNITVMKLPVFWPSVEWLLIPAGLLGSIVLGASAGFEGGTSFTACTSGWASLVAGFGAGASPLPKRYPNELWPPP